MEEPSEEQNHLDEGKYEEEPSYEQQQQQQSESELFWRALESELNEDLPKHVKNVLRLCRLDKPLTFRCISDETIDEAEKFARRHMHHQLMGVELNLEDYYGPYERAPRNFRFAIGDRILIKRMVLCANSKPDEFWRRAPTPPASTRRRRRRFAQANESRGDAAAAAASSELEPSDEEDDRRLRAHEPPDLEQERRKLADMVRAMLQKEEYSEGEEEPRRLAARVKVRVEMKPMQEADGTTRDVVTGHIKCVFCATRLMIRKQSFGTRKPRWVISNYRRHIRFHVDGKLKKTLGLECGEHERRCKNELVADAQANETLEREPEAEEQEMEEAYA